MKAAIRSGRVSDDASAPRSPRIIDGWVFAYEITATHFTLKLFRCIPVAWLRLDRVRHIRQRSDGAFFHVAAELLTSPLRKWYWPHPWMSRSPLASGPYVIRMASGRGVYVRLRTGFHYRLRAAVGEARSRTSGAA